MRDRTHKSCVAVAEAVAEAVFVHGVSLSLCESALSGKFNFDGILPWLVCSVLCVLCALCSKYTEPEKPLADLGVLALNYTAYVPNINYPNQFY